MTNKKKKGILIGIIAGAAAGIIALTSTITSFVTKSNKKQTSSELKNTTSITELSDMGVELEIPEEEIKEKYEEPTGSVEIDKIVEKDGVIYADQENADKSKDVGKSSIDTKGGTLEVDSDGKVKEKEEGYEIKDNTGSTIAKGDLDEDGLPSGFEKNEETGEAYEEKDNADNLVYADATYYNEEGNVLLEKGDLISKEKLDYIKKNFSTKKPTTSSNSSNTSSSNSNSSNTSTSNNSTTSSNTDEGKLNKDGTYTIYGLTFKSKADYEKWVAQGGEGYVEDGGIMVPKTSSYSTSSINLNSSSSKINSSSTTNSNSVSSNTSSKTNSSSKSSSTSSTTDKGITNSDGTYTIDGITYLSKADYQQCIIDGYEGYAIIDGIMQPIDQYTNQTQKVK